VSKAQVAMNETSSSGMVSLTLSLAVLAGLLAVSSQSLWIDEANSAIKAVQPNWINFQARLIEDRGSDLQMPLYMVSLWGWEKIFGRSEFALRALNIPLFCFAILFMWSQWNLDQRGRWFFLIFALLSPFLWAYLDEARPYILQFLGACLMIGPLLRLTVQSKSPELASERSGLTPHPSDLWFFGLGAVVLCGASLIGVIYTFFFGLAFSLLCLANGGLSGLLRSKHFWLVAVVTGVPLAILGIYYAWTLQVGAKASAVGQTNLFSLGFVVYELLGFSGLGPGRADLRENPVAALREYAIPLGIAGLVWFFFLVMVLRALLHNRPYFDKRWLLLGGTILACGVTIVALGVVGEFRIVGRHLMPLYPFLLLLLAICASTIWQRRGPQGRVAVVLLGGLSLVSSLCLRFSPVHAKDDYRSAATTAKEVLDQGGIVWWAADESAAEFYGLPEAQKPNQSGGDASKSPLLLVSNTELTMLELLTKPDLVVLSKPDIYDAKGAIGNWLSGQQIEQEQLIPAFTLRWLFSPVGVENDGN
jgi:hypothetical protein